MSWLPNVKSALRCQAFLFDLDGVLVDSRAVVERTWRRWALRHAIDPDRLLRVAHGRRTRDTLGAVAPQLDVDPEVAWLDAAELEDVEGITAVRGALPLLSRLPSTAWAVVTSAGRALAQRRLAAAGLPLPAVLVSSEDVVSGKPAPDGYRLAMERLGRRPTACLAFEDAPPGLQAARTAGLRVVALTTTHAGDELREADALTPDLAALTVRADGDGFVVTIT